MAKALFKNDKLFKLGVVLTLAGQSAIIGGLLGAITGFSIAGITVASVGALMAVVGYIADLM